MKKTIVEFDYIIKHSEKINDIPEIKTKIYRAFNSFQYKDNYCLNIFNKRNPVPEVIPIDYDYIKNGHCERINFQIVTRYEYRILTHIARLIYPITEGIIPLDEFDLKFNEYLINNYPENTNLRIYISINDINNYELL